MNTPEHASLLVIGCGPGGYAAAFLAADLGLDVTVVNPDKNPGGVCLYRGCIPTKALLHAAKIISDSREAHNFGIEIQDININLGKINSWKDDVVNKLTEGLGQLRKMRKIRYIQGRASFINSGAVRIDTTEGEQKELSFDHAILATGSSSIHLPFEPKSDRIMDSEGALNVTSVPKTLLIVGGGYIGLEFATAYSELGSQVTVAEMLPDLLPPADRDMVALLEKKLSPRLKAIHTRTKVTQFKETQNGLLVTLQHDDGTSITEEFEKVLISVGRKPLTKDIGLENTRVELDPSGFVKVNGQRQTTDPKIYAVGDIAGQPMLAHKASHEGRVAAQVIAGQKAVFAPQSIPAVVYTNPEIVWCGLTEDEAKKQNRKVKILKFPWAASGRALTLKRTDGLTKLIVDAQDGRVLGLCIVGESASELVAAGALAIEMGAKAEDIAKTIHPHPTLSETVMEAAEGFLGQSTHIFHSKKL